MLKIARGQEIFLMHLASPPPPSLPPKKGYVRPKKEISEKNINFRRFPSRLKLRIIMTPLITRYYFKLRDFG